MNKEKVDTDWETNMDWIPDKCARLKEGLQKLADLLTDEIVEERCCEEIEKTPKSFDSRIEKAEEYLSHLRGILLSDEHLRRFGFMTDRREGAVNERRK